eukprot:872709-Rhodomonas_salina.1
MLNSSSTQKISVNAWYTHPYARQNTSVHAPVPTSENQRECLVHTRTDVRTPVYTSGTHQYYDVSKRTARSVGRGAKAVVRGGA